MNPPSDETDTAEILEFVLDNPGKRIDHVLTGKLPDLSRTMIQKLLKDGQVLVDGRPVKPNFKLSGGETAVVTLPEPVNTDLVPDDIPSISFMKMTT